MTFGANANDQNSQSLKEMKPEEVQNTKGNFADVVVSRTLRYHILLTHRYLFDQKVLATSQSHKEDNDFTEQFGDTFGQPKPGESADIVVESIEESKEKPENTIEGNEGTYGVTEMMASLNISEKANDDNASEVSTPSQQQKKKKGKKKPKTVSAEEKTANESAVGTRTRGRLAAFLAQKQQNNPDRKQKIGVVYDDQMALHRCHRKEHPERPERLMAVYLNLVKKELYK